MRRTQPGAGSSRCSRRLLRSTGIRTPGHVRWETGAHPVWGMIRDQWAQNGWENGPYGYPTSDEYRDPEYDGFRQDFQNGSILAVDMKVPAYGYKDPSPTRQSDGEDLEPRTWPFGDFCVLGTYGGPGGACRFGDGVTLKDAGCMATIVVAVGSLVIPAAKLVKIAKFIKGVGGAREAWELWRGARTPEERAATWANFKNGSIPVEIAKDFLMIPAIQKACQ
ncbi:LGFP repeat-containing protein [Nocardia sp. NPDC051570]|uniref:LGFP repeat-containing protein n=1 Tax=Nocardia sp. NPDC051570 TaxID=3364324 RepID=UPI003792B050